MAPLPKRRHSSQRQAKRTRALITSRVTLSVCSNCKSPTQPHMVCALCGYYDGKPVLTITKK